MKRPILKRAVKIIEIVTWTIEYEDVPEGEASPAPPETAGDAAAPETPPAQPGDRTENSTSRT